MLTLNKVISLYAFLTNWPRIQPSTQGYARM